MYIPGVPHTSIRILGHELAATYAIAASRGEVEPSWQNVDLVVVHRSSVGARGGR